MAKFENFQLSHVSNNVVVQDGFDTYAIREDGTQVWAATTGENLSRLQVEIDDADMIRAAREAVLGTAAMDDLVPDSVGTKHSAGLAYSEAALRELRLHVSFLAPERTIYRQEDGELIPTVQANPWTDAEKVAYLWDALKIALSTPEVVS